MATNLGRDSIMYDYPGLGLPLRNEEHYETGYPIGAHSNNYESSCDLIFVRELAMMDVMEKITDKPDWHKKVFDDQIVEKWEKEALAIPDKQFYSLAMTAGSSPTFGNHHEAEEKIEGIMTEWAFAYCIEELRSKAKHLERTGVIPCLDAFASAAKADNLVTEELHGALRKAFDTLKADHEASPDWHPNTNDTVQDLLHPSMYPLVYGRTRAFKEECVGVEDAIMFWAGKGTIIPVYDHPDERMSRYSYLPGGHKVPPEYWSKIYQWLPANVALQSDGSVKFTSYINNLHPNKFPSIYRTIEKLIESSLHLWDQCLVLVNEHGVGRMSTRIEQSEDPDDENAENWTPGNPKECADWDVNEADLEDWIAEEGDDRESCGPEELAQYKWELIRKPRLPEPPPFENIDYAPKEGQRFIDRYRESGLQVIVKMASIELTPEKPEFPVGGWHVEGQMNEHICGTALYYLDSENVTTSSLSFRMQTYSDMNDGRGYDVRQNSYTWMEMAYGAEFSSGPCLQNYGSIETRPGRLLAFPNVFQHRVSPFKLIDPTKPGHRRFIALWLVDPTMRIISTANVPPQQMSWYADSVFGSTLESRKEAIGKLPAELVGLLQEKGLPAAVFDDESSLGDNAKLPKELMDMVQEHFDAEAHSLPMSINEAKEHRAKLMRERGAFQSRAETAWRDNSYSFCEH